MYRQAAAQAFLKAYHCCGTHGDGYVHGRCPVCNQITEVAAHGSQHRVNCSVCGTRFTILCREGQEFIQKARQHLEAAIELEPTNAEYYMLMAWSYFYSGDMESSINWAERGVNADDRVDIFDLDDLFELCGIYAFANKQSDLKSNVLTMLSLDSSVEHREYVKMRLIHLALEYWRLARFKPAASIAEAARLTDSQDTELQHVAATLSLLARVEDEWVRAQKDSKLPGYLKLRFVWCIINSLPESPDTIDREELTQYMFAAMDSTPASFLRGGIRYVKSAYPAYCELDQQHLDELEKLLSRSRISSPGTSTPEGAGCVLILVVLAATAGILVLGW